MPMNQQDVSVPPLSPEPPSAPTDEQVLDAAQKGVEALNLRIDWLRCELQIAERARNLILYGLNSDQPEQDVEIEMHRSDPGRVKGFSVN